MPRGDTWREMREWSRVGGGVDGVRDDESVFEGIRAEEVCTLQSWDGTLPDQKVRNEVGFGAGRSMVLVGCELSFIGKSHRD